MGIKTLPDTMTDRIRKAVQSGQEFNNSVPSKLALLAGKRGYFEICMLAEYQAIDYLSPRWNPVVQPLLPFPAEWGSVRGHHEAGILVFTPEGFRDNVIELRDIAGQFSYTIDLS